MSNNGRASDSTQDNTAGLSPGPQRQDSSATNLPVNSGEPSENEEGIPPSASPVVSASSEQPAVEKSVKKVSIPIKESPKADESKKQGKIPTSTRGSGRSSNGRATMVVGEELEYRVSRLFTHRGYFVRRGRVIYTIGRLDQATDLDVLAIRHSEFFKRELVIAECKSGGEGPLDRVFWLSGVKQFARADQAFLVRKPTKWNIKDFAKEVGIDILDLERLTMLEDIVGISPDDWPGLTDIAFVKRQAPEWNEWLKADDYIADMYLSLAGETKFTEPFGSINFLIHHMRSLTREHKKPVPARQSLIRYLLTEAASQLGIFMLSVAGLSFDLALSDRQGLITKRLIHGELDADLTQRVFDRAYHLARQAASMAVNAPVPMDRDLFSMPSPDYVQSIVNSVEHLISQATVANTMVPMVDLILAESFVKGNRKSPWLKRIFKQSDFFSRVALAHEFIGFLERLECLPVNTLSSVSGNV